MAPVACFAQLKHGAASDHFTAMLQKDFNQLFEVAQLGLAVDQRHHVHTEGVLQLRLLVEVVEHHLGHFAALEFNHQAHAGLVRFVLDVADAFNLLFVHQLGHALLQRLFVHLVGQLIDDDGLALAAINVFKVHLGTHDDFAAPGAVAVFHACDAVDDAGRWEVRRGHDFHQLVDRGLGVVQEVQAGIHHFVEVVRWNVGRHAHGNACAAVDQQVGQAAGQHQGFFFAAVVVGAEIDGFFVDVGQHFVRDLRQTDFRVAHGGSVVAIDRAEVALAIDQHMAQRKILRHAHNGVVHRDIAVRVVFTNHVTNDAC